RMGNEFVFQMLAMQNIETLNEAKATKIVATCPHCFNTVNREYPELGGNYEVVHHTELLNELVANGKLQPVNSVEGSATYHDPCFLGRHNKVYSPPRELISAVGQLQYKEMERSKERSFCCGAGGARMWMEETIGQRINDNRTEEALSLNPDTIVTGCPFCKTMISDSVAGKQGAGDKAAEGVQVIDVAQLLVQATRPVKVGVAADGPSAAPSTAPAAAPSTNGVATEAADSPDEPLGSDPGAGSDGAATPDPDVAADPEADPIENPRTDRHP
ncbi:MAG TPA: (Fe-S)-binding protein, partial [Sporichthya sp.]|nr:(Fe-S)-binding protein [Sporichthya sp.]